MKNKKYLFLLLIIVPIIVFFVGRSFSLEYTQEIKSVEIESDDYDDPGSFHIDKSAKWVSFTEAEVTFDLNTIYKERENANYKDVILVIDISGSMSGTKLDKAKSDAMELVDTLLSDSNNHVALITFDSSSEIVSGFINNKNEMLEMIENLTTKGCTNYNAGLLNVLEVMEDYQKDDNHDLVTLFLTDGFPNEDIPNQVATYHIIKDKYPYMTINGIQYEMGRVIIQEIIDISDNQWLADQETLNGVLFDAVITPLLYETFVVSDYVNKDYFYLDNISDVTVSKGTIQLQEENGLQKIVWTLDDNFTGFNANMKIKLQLKSEYHNTRGFYPTNDHETIDYKIMDDEEKTVDSTLTPVLKRAYNVIYDTNAPDGCTLPDIPTEEHYVYETVTKRTETLVCEGYVFKGYQFDSEYATDINIINNDTFVMPGHDVIVRGTWAQQGLVKSMDGTVHEKLEGTLMNHYRYYSQTFGKSISRDSFESITTVDNIDVPSNAIDSWDASQEQNGSVIAWYIDNDSDNLYELYIGQEDGVKANPDSSYTFYYFRKAEVINLTNYDISDVTNMSYMFSKAGYNSTTLDIINISDWDTTKVTDMSFMFDQTGYNATTFNLDLGGWNTSSVTTMKCMLQAIGYKATTWDIGDISDWNTINVTDMTNMFNQTGYNATTFNLDLSSWNTSSVTTMKSMFNQTGYSATTWSIGDLSNWNTVNVTDMGSMFNASGYKATTWDIGDISEWNTSNVTNMNGMFSYAGYNTTTFDIGDLSEWNTSKVTTMYQMFYYAGYSATTWSIGDISEWDTSNVTNMNGMFAYAGRYAMTWNIGNLSDWDTSQVTSMYQMFAYAGYKVTTWNIGDLSEWNTANVTNMSYMFYNAGYSATTWSIGNLSNWNTANVTDMSNMFAYAGYKATTWNIGDLSGWDTSSVTNMSSMFSQAGYNATTFELDLTGWNTLNVTDIRGMFSGVGYKATTWSIGDLSGWKTGNVTNMSNMFNKAGYNATTFYLGDLSNWDTSKVTTMQQMFLESGHEASTWYVGKLSGWVTSSVTTMMSLFNDAGSNAEIFELDLTNWDVSSVTSMNYLFYSSGRNATTWKIGDLSNWNTSSVTNMDYMFNAAGKNAEVWENIGTLKVYNARIIDLFSGCNNARATINIYSDITFYSYAFTNAATIQGSGITVNYSSTTTNIDAIIATKSSTSNVTKGVQLD